VKRKSPIRHKTALLHQYIIYAVTFCPPLAPLFETKFRSSFGWNIIYQVKFCEHRWVSRTCYVVSETKVPHMPYNCIIRKKYESIFSSIELFCMFFSVCNSGQFFFFQVLLNEKHSIYSQNLPFLQFFVVIQWFQMINKKGKWMLNFTNPDEFHERIT
jgi:hypothetical protein